MWVYDPQSGGKKIPDALKPWVRQRILDHAEKYYAGKYNRIDVRFRGQFCYYESCVFNNGDWCGTLEEAFDTSAVYLSG